MNNHIFRERESLTSTSKKVISILVVALMVTVVLCAIDTDGDSNRTKVNEKLVLGNAAVTDINEYFSEGTAKYEYKDSEGVLTLTDAVKTINTTEAVNCAIETDVDLKIVVIGENLVELQNTGATDKVYGIKCKNKLTIVSGDQSKTCSLTVSTEKTKVGGENYGMDIDSDTTIADGVIVTAKSGESGNGYSCGLETKKIVMNKSSLFAYGGKSTGLSSIGLRLSSGISTITDSLVVAEASDAYIFSVGIDTGPSNVNFSGSEIHATANGYAKDDGNSYGMRNYKLRFDNTALSVISKKSAFLYVVSNESFTETNKIMGIKYGSETEEQITGNVTEDYKSICTYVTRNVIYDTDGGSVINEVKVDSFTKFNLASAPTKAGYTFKGWIDENGTTYQAGAEYTMPGHSTKFTAVWKASEHSSESFWETPGNIAGVAVISLLILLFLGLIIWDRKT